MRTEGSKMRSFPLDAGSGPMRTSFRCPKMSSSPSTYRASGSKRFAGERNDENRGFENEELPVRERGRTISRNV